MVQLSSCDGKRTQMRTVIANALAPTAKPTAVQKPSLGATGRLLPSNETKQTSITGRRNASPSVAVRKLQRPLTCEFQWNKNQNAFSVRKPTATTSKKIAA